MNKKLLGFALAFVFLAMLAAPMVSAKPWNYPKNNPKFEEFGVTFQLNWGEFIAAEYAATAGLEDANKLVITNEETMLSYQIRIGEDGPGQRIYNLGEDFTYTGKMTYTVFDPILPYAFNPDDLVGTLFVTGRMAHLRIDYMYDFSAVPGGLEGTIKLVALVTGNTLMLIGDKPTYITSLQCTGDFQNVNIKATVAGLGHTGVVSGWPE